jgi:hypothetical protein
VSYEDNCGSWVELDWYSCSLPDCFKKLTCSRSFCFVLSPMLMLAGRADLTSFAEAANLADLAWRSWMDVCSRRTAAQAARRFGSHEDERVHGWMFAFFCPATVLFWERGDGDLVWSGLFQ